MDKPMSLPVAMAQLNQAMTDFTNAHDAAMAADPAIVQLQVAMAYGKLREMTTTTMTDENRRHLASAKKSLGAILGIKST